LSKAAARDKGTNAEEASMQIQHCRWRQSSRPCFFKDANFAHSHHEVGTLEAEVVVNHWKQLLPIAYGDISESGRFDIDVYGVVMVPEMYSRCIFTVRR
jgi:hypothetical protein